MPVIGRGDEDRVDVFGQDFAVVEVGGRESVGALFHRIAMRPIDVADRDDLIVAELVGGIEEIVHAASSADDSNTQSVVGAEDAGGG